MIRKASRLGLVALLFLSGCGGSGKSAKSADNVNCPPGQSFDGEFCQVDQTVATLERPAPESEQEESELIPVEESNDTTVLPSDDPEEPEPVQEELPPPTPPKMASPVDVTMAAQAGPLVQYLASSHLPAGARPFGAPFAGQFAEGQILERTVQLSVGKCYTVVAVGLPPIVEVNVELFREGEKDAAAQDNTRGVQAVLGSRQDCFSPSASGTYRLVLTAEKGQGIAAAQAFEKP